MRFDKRSVSLFHLQHVTAQPPIEAYMPTKEYTAESAVDVATLDDCIEKIDVPGAITVYEALVASKSEIPAESKQSLLELVTFYNGSSPTPTELFEERDIASSYARGRDHKPEEWKVGGFAERLFVSIEPKTSATYSAMIRGLVKYNQPLKANALFEEIVAKDVPIDTGTYNAIIQSIIDVVPRPQERWAQVEKLLRQMNDSQVKPNVQTLNAVLGVVRHGSYIESQRQHALNVLAEFKALNIEPSLGTWYMMLKIFCRERGQTSHILVDIIDHIGDKELKCETPSDLNFFMTAMSVCNIHLNDFELAKRVDRLLNIGRNHKLLGDSFSQRLYYRSYIELALKSMPFAEFIELYDDLIPNLQSLESYLCAQIIGKINETGTIELIPKFWSDMLVADIVSYRYCGKTMDNFLDVMCDNPPQPDVPAHADLQERFGECAWNYWEKINSELAMNRIQNVAGTTLAKILRLVCRQKKHKRAAEMWEGILAGTARKSVSGVLSYEALQAFVESRIEDRDLDRAIDALNYSVMNGIGDSVVLGKLILDRFTMDERHKRKVTNLVGNVQTKKQKV